MGQDIIGDNGTKLPKPSKKPGTLVTELSGAQTSGNTLNEQAYWANNFLVFANGGSANNPMGFPGYSSLYTGTYSTYRWMLRHPILRLARSISVSNIIGSQWEYSKVDSSVPESQVQLVKKVFDKLRVPLLNDFFVRGRDFGWSVGEPIWEMFKGDMIITRVKPLLQDVTVAINDPFTGDFQGVRNFSIGYRASQQDLSAPFKCWKYSYDSEAGYVYGRSWLENARDTAWKDWLDCAQQLQKLSSKISGTVTVVTSPAGSFMGSDGKPSSYRANAELVIKALAEGAAGVWFPSLSLQPDSKGNIDAMKVLVELAGKSLTNINPLDFGSQAPAIHGILERMKHNEMLMFAASLRPSRIGLEGQHGTKAEAETHTDTGTVNSENEDQDFATACQPMVDAVLMVNAGDDAKGNVIIKPPSLVDRKTQLLRAILLAVLGHQPIAQECLSTMDMDKFMDFLKIDRSKDFSIADLKKAIESQAKSSESKDKKNPEPQGGRPTNN